MASGQKKTADRLSLVGGFSHPCRQPSRLAPERTPDESTTLSRRPLSDHDGDGLHVAVSIGTRPRGVKRHDTTAP
jgi:hypothetical protein